MSNKTENWQEALLRVRQGLNTTPVIVEKTEEQLISDEIDTLLEGFVDTTEEVVSASPEEVLIALEEVVAEDEAEKPVSKLLEKNMLGRLAKSMDLNEQNKSKLFEYFETGELEQ